MVTINIVAAQFSNYLIITSNKNETKLNTLKVTHLTKRTSEVSTIFRSDLLDCHRKMPVCLKIRPQLIPTKSNNRMR